LNKININISYQHQLKDKKLAKSKSAQLALCALETKAGLCNYKTSMLFSFDILLCQNYYFGVLNKKVRHFLITGS